LNPGELLAFQLTTAGTELARLGTLPVHLGAQTLDTRYLMEDLLCLKLFSPLFDFFLHVLDVIL